MKKEKFHIEYIFDKVSRRSLWNHLTTPPGLSAWFADDVIINGNIYVFKWNKAEQEAEVLSIKPEMSIRYRWMDEEDENAYFEFQIHSHELTGQKGSHMKMCSALWIPTLCRTVSRAISIRCSARSWM